MAMMLSASFIVVGTFFIAPHPTHRFPENSLELYAEKLQNRGLHAVTQCESLRYKLLGGLAVRHVAYGVLRFIMESGAKGCEVDVSGKLLAARFGLPRIYAFFSFSDGITDHRRRAFVAAAVAVRRFFREVPSNPRADGVAMLRTDDELVETARRACDMTGGREVGLLRQLGRDEEVSFSETRRTFRDPAQTHSKGSYVNLYARPGSDIVTGKYHGSSAAEGTGQRHGLSARNAQYDGLNYGLRHLRRGKQHGPNGMDVSAQNPRGRNTRLMVPIVIIPDDDASDQFVRLTECLIGVLANTWANWQLRRIVADVFHVREEVLATRRMHQLNESLGLDDMDLGPEEQARRGRLAAAARRAMLPPGAKSDPVNYMRARLQGRELEAFNRNMAEMQRKGLDRCWAPRHQAVYERLMRGEQHRVRCNYTRPAKRQGLQMGICGGHHVGFRQPGLALRDIDDLPPHKGDAYLVARIFEHPLPRSQRMAPSCEGLMARITYELHFMRPDGTWTFIRYETTNGQEFSETNEMRLLSEYLVTLWDYERRKAQNEERARQEEAHLAQTGTLSDAALELLEEDDAAQQQQQQQEEQRPAGPRSLGKLIVRLPPARQPTPDRLPTPPLVSPPPRDSAPRRQREPTSGRPRLVQSRLSFGSAASSSREASRATSAGTSRAASTDTGRTTASAELPAAELTAEEQQAASGSSRQPIVVDSSDDDDLYAVPRPSKRPRIPDDE